MAGLTHKKYRIKFVVSLLLLLGLTLVISPSAYADNADGPFISEPLRNQMVDYQQLTYTLACLPTSTIVNAEYALPGDPPMENVGQGDMVFASNDQLSNKKYLDQGVLGASIGRGHMFDNAALPCDSGKNFGFVWPFEEFGRNNLVDFFCGLPGVYHNLTGGRGKTVAGGSTKAACVSGSEFTNGKSFFVAKSGTNLRSQVKAEFTNTNRGRAATQDLTPAKKYIQYWLTFDKACDAKLTTEYPRNSDPAANNGAVYRIPVVNQNGKIVDFIANTGGPSTDGKKIVLDAKDTYPGSTTCGQLAIGMRDTANAYSNYLKGPGKNDPGATDGTGIPENVPEDDEPGNTTSCAIDGIGWIICPVMNFLAEANEAAFGVIKNFLTIRPSLVQDEATVKAWSSFRDLANIAFVIAFLVIIYSQITSMGVSNYGIKKLLPKIAAAAILVNLSLFICQILVDVSNIAGSSLYSFIANLVEPLEGSEFDSGSAWSTIMTGVLIAGVGVLLIAMVVTAPVVLLAVGLVLLILVARQAFILILVIVAPLAFVAYLLPNTEDFFKKWWKALSATLLIYPIIAVVFGASELASNILMGIASDEGNTSAANMNDDSQLLAIVALAVMAVPLFALPALLKGAMAGAGSIGARLQGMADKSQSRAQNRVKAKAKDKFDNSMVGQYRNYRRNEANKRRAMMQAGVYEGRGGRMNPRNWRSAASGMLVNNSGKFGESVQSRGGDIADKMWDEAVGNQQKFMISENKNSAELHSIVTDKNASSEKRAAAAGLIMKRGSMEDIHKLIESTQTLEANSTKPSTASGIRKQMMSDMNRTPFGMGAGDKSMMERGEAMVDEGGNVKNYASMLNSRAEKKLSGGKWASLDPDDQKALAGLATSGVLSDKALQNLINATAEAETNDNIDVVDETKQHGASIRAYGAQRNITPQQPSQPPTQGESGDEE